MTVDTSPRPPRPGHGAVFVTLQPDGRASAVWQDEQRFATFEGATDQAVAWARRQPAGRVYLPAGDGHGFVEARGPSQGQEKEGHAR